MSPQRTRDCLDPWRYVEISAAGQVRPCCNFDSLAELGDGGPEIGAIRNNEKFRALRESLLRGDLQPPCERCHIRKMVPVGTLKRRLVARRLADAGPWRNLTNPLEPLRIAEIRIDINEKCNLRCDYCAVSSPGYRGVEMDGALFTRIEKLLTELGPQAMVHANGHGETTYHPHWMAICRKIIDAGYRPHIITNLAKSYSDEEIELLSRFSSIQVSLDSDDDDMMRKIRKAVRATHVFETIQRIRNAAAHRGVHPAPRLSFSIGLYDPSIWTLESFVSRILAFGVRDMTFWNLVEMQHQTLVKPLRLLDMTDQDRARRIVADVRHKLEREGVNYIFAGDFDSMVDEEGNADFWRSVARRVYRAFNRRAAAHR